jgi:hypothetical protein
LGERHSECSSFRGERPPTRPGTAPMRPLWKIPEVT